MKKNLSLTVILMAFAIGAIAQAQLVGRVVDAANNEALIGATIVEKGTSNGTVTDVDGNFTFTTQSDAGVVLVSFVGYLSQEIEFSGAATLNVSMKADVTGLEEVVVVGYGIRKKSDVTGSVSSVKSEELNAFPVLNAEQALQGRAAGVVVQSNNGGEPGAPISIKIRGNTSINASSDPLVVVDGFVGASMPQAHDIQSIEILKDASATAIYGSRGSNGVVLVTTKKGKSGKLTVEVNSSYSLQNTTDEMDLLDADEFASWQQSMNSSYVQGDSDTDWQDLLYRTGSTQNHQFSFSGGTGMMNFYASVNYFNQKGVILNSEYEKISFLSNVDAQVTKNLKLGLNLSGSRSDKDGVGTQASGLSGGADDVASLMFRFAPDLGIYDENGDYTINSVGEDVDNPYAVAKEVVNETKADKFRANVYADYEIFKGLNFKTTGGFRTTNQTVGTFRPSSLLASSGGTSSAGISTYKRTNILTENYLTYIKKLGKGNLTVMGGFSYQKTSTQRFSAGAQGFISDSFSYHNLSGASTFTIPTSSLTETEIQSFFGRVNYDYDDRFLLTATVRRDGASNFAKNEKYAIFPSGALAWKVSNEEWLKNHDKISNLKLRASYGVTGNQAISAYQSLAGFDNIYSVLDGEQVNAVVPDQAANPDLKWESSYQTNFGVDFGMFNNRISLTLDYYNIDTKDLIIGDSSQPEYFGFLTTASLRNVGEVNNKGFEIALTTTNITKKDFSWTTDLNWSTNKNEIVSLLDGEDIFLDASPGYFNIDRTHVLREGETPGLFWGYEYRGVYQGGDLPEGTAIFEGAEAGDQLFTDIDGSGVITTADQMTIGDPNPDWTFGFTNNFTYKNFDLNIFIQGVYGGDVMNLNNVQLFNGDSNASKDILNAWTESNTDTDIPRNKLRGKQITSRFVEDGSYIRLKNIALGYNLPNELVEKWGFENIRLAVSAQNLLTFTDYSGLDPEVSYFGSGGESSGESNTTNGFDFGNYPTVRSVNFSVNVKF